MKQLLNEYPPGTARGGCYLCAASTRTLQGRREQIIDTGITVDYEGRLAICECCVLEMASHYGLVPASDHDTLTARVADLEEQLSVAHAQAEAASQALDALRRVDALTPPPDPTPEPEPEPAAPAKAKRPAKKAAA